MRDVSYWEAWSLWFSGEPTEDLRLWGQPMFVWGRLGKFLQVVGALTVIVDIIGPDRIKGFGDSLSAQDTRVRAWQEALSRLRERAKEWPFAAGAGLFFLLWLGGIANGVFIFGRAAIKWEWPKDPLAEYQSDFWPWGLIILSFPVWAPLTLGLLFYVLPAGFLRLIELAGLALNAFVVQPVASSLRWSGVNASAKIAGLLMLLIGAQFDLLAS